PTLPPDFLSVAPALNLDSSQAIDLPIRLRRNRKSPAIRALLQETRLHPTDFVSPLFILDGSKQKQEISSMPGVYRYSIDRLLQEVEESLKLGIQAVDLFIVVNPDKKDPLGSEALREDNLLFRSIRTLKAEFPQLCVMADIALDPFTDHGHDGLVNNDGEVINDATLKVLGQMSLLSAQAGVDIVAPSDMMDGRVGYIRSVLDRGGYSDVGILAYAAKYASAFYGPFRDALGSAPKFGDKKSYQMNPANKREALLESYLDENEGADMLLIKPALAYLDIIAKVKENTNLPVGAYHVSGEYAMVKAAALQGWVDGDRIMHECLLSIKRAGADFILTYAAKEMARKIREEG
ncbi:MAG TPA: porphobilinogen synthase, partial [Parachlamydiaceae bacterium]|nr:porphobilinogen synthase [Parachlamydiaceae bacterium]